MMKNKNKILKNAKVFGMLSLAVFTQGASADSIKLFSAMPVVYSGTQTFNQEDAVSLGTKKVVLQCETEPAAVISSSSDGFNGFVVDNFLAVNGANVCPSGACFSGIKDAATWSNIYYGEILDSTAAALDIFYPVDPINISEKLQPGDQLVKFDLMDMGVTSGSSDIWLTTNCVAPPRIVICHKPGTPAEKTLKVAQSAASDHLDHGDTLGECPTAE